MTSGSRAKSRITKAEQAEETRRRIVRGATTLFLRDGFVTSTMAAIAQESGVAVQTLYLSFGSKTAILRAALDAALQGDEPEGLLEADWFRRVLSEPDGPAALRLFCTEAKEVISRAAPLFDVLRAAAADPEVAEVLAGNKAARQRGYRQVAESLASRTGFATGLTADDAWAILYTTVSEDTFLLMVTECGWTPDRWATWTAQVCTRSLFA